LEERLNEALRLGDPPAPVYTDMENRLNEIVAWLQKKIDPTTSKAQVTLEPGHLVNVGQQFNVVVYIPNRNQYRDTLFRAYIPASGTPVTLDFIGDAPEKADTADQLEERVIAFFSRDPIRAMIRTVYDTAAKTPPKTHRRSSGVRKNRQ